jgi:hypothetical protein
MAKGKFTRNKPTLAALQAQMRSQAPSGWGNKTSATPLAFMDKTPRAPRKPRAPGQKNAHEENTTQAAVVHYLHQMCPQVTVSASMNGEIGYIRRFMSMQQFMGLVARFKAKGMLKGELDLMLTWHPARIIFIELKKEKGGVVSEAQELVHKARVDQGFKVYVLDNGIDGLKEIISLEAIPCREHHYSTPF